LRTAVLFLLLLPTGLNAQQNAPAQPQVDSSLPMMIIDMETGDTHMERSTTGSAGELGRWLGLQTMSLSTRYRHIESFRGATTASNAQYQITLRGAFRFDSGGRFTVHAGLFTGNSFTAGWNNTAVGTGTGQSNLYLKQLFFEAKPVSGIELQYGGLAFARGESSEITSYDYNGYLVGERVRIHRPERVFFDEIAVTYGYVGDLSRPGVFTRIERLTRSNYHQFLIAKQLSSRFRVSADSTIESGVQTLRQALTLYTPELHIAEMVHFEQYERTGTHIGYGFSAYGEKKVGRRVTVGPGYAQLDRRGLYSDRFNVGKRLFWNTHIALGPEWSVMALATYAVAGPADNAPRTRFDLIIGYNLLHRFQTVME
jgi:hypothetical protein